MTAVALETRVAVQETKLHEVRQDVSDIKDDIKDIKKSQGRIMGMLIAACFTLTASAILLAVNIAR